MTDQPRRNRFSTLAIHAGARPVEVLAYGELAGDSPDPLRALRTLGSAVSASGPQLLLEERIAALEGGSAAVAVASGEIARLATCRTLMQPGDDLVVAIAQSDGWIRQFEQSFQSFGWRAKLAAASSPQSFVEALSDKSKAILINSLSPEDGVLADIEAIARVARRARVPLIVDNSWATPALLRPLDHGADIVLYSDCSALCGSPTAAGLIVDGGTFDWTNDPRYPAISDPAAGSDGLAIADAVGNFAFAVASRLAATRDLGAAALPADASSLVRGVETLALRMSRHCENALAVARALVRRADVAQVDYPGLPSHPQHTLSQRYCPSGAGAGLRFTLREERNRGAFLRRLKLFSQTSGIGNTRSAAFPLSDAGSVLFSLGLEDQEDILADLDQALAGSHAAGTMPA